MSWADTLAVKSTIEEIPALATKTVVAFSPKPLAVPYVVIYPSDGVPEQARFTGPPTRENPSFILHVVGDAAQPVQDVAAAVKAKFVVNGFVIPPAVAGRVNYDGYFSSPLPLQLDKDVTPPLVFQVLELGWVSDPA